MARVGRDVMAEGPDAVFRRASWPQLAAGLATTSLLLLLLLAVALLVAHAVSGGPAAPTAEATASLGGIGTR